jgi:hypothetical protein
MSDRLLKVPARGWSIRRCGLFLLVAPLLAIVVGTPGAAALAPTPIPTPAVTPSATPAPPGGGAAPATFGIGPASATKLDGRSVLNYGTSPGGRADDHVAVENFATTPVTISIYVVDAVNGTDGAFTFQAQSAARLDASKWFSFATLPASGTVTIAARTALILPVTLTVPADASPGDHSAGIVASLTSQVKSDSGQNINFEQRVALRTFIRVSGAILPALSVEKLTASYHGTMNPIGRGDVTIKYTIHNTGNVNLGGRQRVKISGAFGTTGTIATVADIPVLLPGARYSVTVRARDVWPQLLMHARVSVTPLAGVGDDDPGLHNTSTTASFWAIPWTLVGLVVLFGLLIALAFFLRRRAKRRSTGGRHGPDAGKNLEPIPVG